MDCRTLWQKEGQRWLIVSDLEINESKKRSLAGFIYGMWFGVWNVSSDICLLVVLAFFNIYLIKWHSQKQKHNFTDKCSVTEQSYVLPYT